MVQQVIDLLYVHVLSSEIRNARKGSETTASIAYRSSIINPRKSNPMEYSSFNE